MSRQRYPRTSWNHPPTVYAPPPDREFTPEKEGLPAAGVSCEMGRHEPIPYGEQDGFNTAWESPAALASYVEKALHTRSGWRHVNYFSTEGGPDWAWNFMPSQALAMEKTGWVSGARKVGSDHVNVANTFLSEHTEESTRYDVSGAFVDVAAFLEGSPECMVDFCEEKRETRAVKILLQSFVSCGVSADTIFNRGIAIMGGVLAAQASGIAVTVEMAFSHEMAGTGKDGIHRVTIHRPGDALDTSRMAFYLAHPAFLRQIFMQATYLVTGAVNNMGNANLAKEAGPGVVYLDGMMLDRHPWGTPEANKALIEKIFAAAI